jgi:hypothetical protein
MAAVVRSLFLLHPAFQHLLPKQFARTWKPLTDDIASYETRRQQHAAERARIANGGEYTSQEAEQMEQLAADLLREELRLRPQIAKYVDALAIERVPIASAAMQRLNSEIATVRSQLEKIGFTVPPQEDGGWFNLVILSHPSVIAAQNQYDSFGDAPLREFRNANLNALADCERRSDAERTRLLASL